MQAVFTHEVGTNAGQVAFVGAGEAVEQQAGNRQAQDRIAQELEPLVVIDAKASVSERALEQDLFSEAVSEAGLQCGESRVHRWCQEAVTSTWSFPGI